MVTSFRVFVPNHPEYFGPSASPSPRSLLAAAMDDAFLRWSEKSGMDDSRKATRAAVLKLAAEQETKLAQRAKTVAFLTLRLAIGTHSSEAFYQYFRLLVFWTQVWVVAARADAHFYCFVAVTARCCHTLLRHRRRLIGARRFSNPVLLYLGYQEVMRHGAKACSALRVLAASQPPQHSSRWQALLPRMWPIGCLQPPLLSK